ncbi:MAG: hypothetical protein L6Q37_07515 [Bdellovibrionaceae bacterium]|nr:hypothetical protein [Pseudobdellovibrionaceae bacterium]NUM57720.1 hypothetical protein [Pseudobdellovibrionaceae bacterium]
MKLTAKLILFVSIFVHLEISIAMSLDHMKRKCSSYYIDTIHRGFESLPKATRIEMPEELKKVILEYKKLFEPLGLGEGEDAVITISDISSGMYSLGRHIAAQYIAQILKTLYPKVTIAEKYFDITSQNYWQQNQVLNAFEMAYSQKKRFAISLSDTTNNVFEPTSLNIDMSKIKLANPGVTRVPRSWFRKRLGIPSNDTVFSIYNKSPEKPSLKAPTAAMVIQEILTAIDRVSEEPPALFFISEGGGNYLSFKKPADERLKDYKVISISKWAEQYVAGQKFIVLNDMEGVMPSILNVANAAYVSGPNNIVEPTTAGVPVFFMNNSEVLGSYSKTNFDRMSDIVKATGGGYELQSLNGFQSAYRKFLQNPQVIKPTFMHGEIIESLLVSIYKVLEENPRYQIEIRDKIRSLRQEKNRNEHSDSDLLRW